MILALKPPPSHIEGLLFRLRDKQLTYGEVGETRASVLPRGYHHERAAVTLGLGEAAWATAKDAVATWQAHRHAGLDIFPADSALVEGTVVVAAARLGPARLLLPCRIVYNTNEPRRFGFAYGTLPGHPESGEESFHVIWDDQDKVTFEVVAFSRPGDFAAKMAGPIARVVQSKTTRRYLEGARRYVNPT